MADNFNFTASGYSRENDNFYFGIVPEYIKNILAGTSRNFVAVWADTTANIQTAKFYIASAGTGAAFSVINLATQALVDSYTINTSGVDNETLENTDIIDISVEG